VKQRTATPPLQQQGEVVGRPVTPWSMSLCHQWHHAAFMVWPHIRFAFAIRHLFASLPYSQHPRPQPRFASIVTFIHTVLCLPFTCPCPISQLSIHWPGSLRKHAPRSRSAAAADCYLSLHSSLCSAHLHLIIPVHRLPLPSHNLSHSPLRIIVARLISLSSLPWST
jgi:hypothetical protein